MAEDKNYLYLGADVHKHSSTVTIMDKNGNRLVTEKLLNTKQAFERLLSAFRDVHFQAVLEAGRNWGVIYDLLEDLPNVENVLLANPFKVRAIADAKLKTDTIDSITLANLLRTDYIPAVFVPPKEIRIKKYLLRHRCFLVTMQTRIKNRIHIILERNHISVPPVTDLFGQRGRHFLDNLTLPEAENYLLKVHLEFLDYLREQIKQVAQIIKEEFEEQPEVRLLKTIPGIGDVFAPLIALEICDIKRFSNYKKLWSYAGLVPATYASGRRVYHGGLIKHANKWLRWAFVEAAHSSIRTSFYFGAYYHHKKITIGTQAAMIATARRLAKIVYYVLKEKRPYIEFEPRLSSIEISPRGSGQG